MGFYRGISANISRACVLNGTKMACYDKAKGLSQVSFAERKDPRTVFVPMTIGLHDLYCVPF